MSIELEKPRKNDDRPPEPAAVDPGAELCHFNGCLRAIPYDAPFKDTARTQALLRSLEAPAVELSQACPAGLELLRAVRSTIACYDYLDCWHGGNHLALMAMPERVAWMNALSAIAGAQVSEHPAPEGAPSFVRRMRELFDESLGAPRHWWLRDDLTKARIIDASEGAAIYRLGAWAEFLGQVYGNDQFIPMRTREFLHGKIIDLAGSGGELPKAPRLCAEDILYSATTAAKLGELYRAALQRVLRDRMPDVPDDVLADLRFTSYECVRGSQNAFGPAPREEVWADFERMQREWGTGRSRGRSMERVFEAHELRSWYYGSPGERPGRSLLTCLTYRGKALFTQLDYPTTGDMWPSTAETVHDTVRAGTLESKRIYGWCMLVASSRELSREVSRKATLMYPQALELNADALVPYGTELLLGRVYRGNRARNAHFHAGCRDSGVVVDRGGFECSIISLDMAVDPFKGVGWEQFLPDTK